MNSKIFLSPMYSTYWRWLIFFPKIFLSPPYALHSLTVADFFFFFQNFSKSPYVLHSLTVANFFSKNFSKSPQCSPFVDGGSLFFSEIFLSPPYALHSLQVAMILLNFGNFSKCRKSRFSQSLLFHSIPLPYVVEKIFTLYFVMGSFWPTTAPHFQNFSKSYVLHSLQVANFFFQKFF